MATFRVGQRVRKVSHGGWGGVRKAPIGATGTVRALPGWFPPLPDLYGVDYDGLKVARLFGAADYQLAPLTDPKADAFIERVKSWKPEPAPVAIPVNSK